MAVMRSIVILLAALLMPVVVGAAEGVTVTDAWARASPPGVTKSAVYFRLSLASDAPNDRLVGVVAPKRGEASLHATVSEGGQTRMQALEAVAIPSDGAVAFEPGGRHVMVTGLEEPLAAGDELRLVLRFEQTGERALAIPVRPVTASGP